MIKPVSIGFFDSGIGGLSVLRHALNRVSGSPLIYVADSANTPYGTKSADWIIERSLAIGHFLQEEGAQAIVVACNTATAVAVKTLREKLDVPIIAMEPAIKPASKLSKTRKVAVLATPGTFGSQKYSQLADRHTADIEITNQACQHWVEIVEAGELDSPYTLDQINKDLDTIIQDGNDTLVLGCTHFPFLADAIAKVVGESINIIDPVEAVIDHLCRKLELPESLSAEVSSVTFYTSGDLNKYAEQIRSLIAVEGKYLKLPL